MMVYSFARELIGVERLMWGSDYPHTQGTFPYSREQIAKDFAGIPEAKVSQMVVGNAARLCGLTHRKESLRASGAGPRLSQAFST